MARRARYAGRLTDQAAGGAVAAYALSPIDLIPDFIPVLGLLDGLLMPWSAGGIPSLRVSFEHATFSIGLVL